MTDTVAVEPARSDAAIADPKTPSYYLRLLRERGLVIRADSTVRGKKVVAGLVSRPTLHDVLDVQRGHVVDFVDTDIVSWVKAHVQQIRKALLMIPEVGLMECYVWNGHPIPTDLEVEIRYVNR